MPLVALAVLAILGFLYTHHPYKIAFHGKGVTHSEIAQQEVLKGYAYFLPEAAEEISYGTRPYAGSFQAVFKISEDDVLAWSHSLELTARESENGEAFLMELSEEPFKFQSGLRIAEETVTDAGTEVWVELDYDRTNRTAYIQIHMD